MQATMVPGTKYKNNQRVSAQVHAELIQPECIWLLLFPINNTTMELCTIRVWNGSKTKYQVFSSEDICFYPLLTVHSLHQFSFVFLDILHHKQCDISPKNCTIFVNGKIFMPDCSCMTWSPTLSRTTRHLKKKNIWKMKSD